LIAPSPNVEQSPGQVSKREIIKSAKKESSFNSDFNQIEEQKHSKSPVDDDMIVMEEPQVLTSEFE
jgi:hypothetical protein